jgi:hypothetical protein
VIELGRDAMDGIDDGVAIGNGQRAVRAEVVLYVDDEEDVVWSGLQFSVPCGGHVSSKIGCSKLPSGTVTDVEHFNSLLLFQNAVNYAIDVGLAPIKQLPELVLFWCHRTAIRQVAQAENGFFEFDVPLPRWIGLSGADVLV